MTYYVKFAIIKLCNGNVRCKSNKMGLLYVYMLTALRMVTQVRKGGKAVMARYESEGYCPSIWVGRRLFNPGTDKRLIGLWEITRDAVVYDTDEKYKPQHQETDEIFSSDPIAFSLLSTLIRRNATAKMIKVFQPWVINSRQQLADLQQMLSAKPNSTLVSASKSNFIALVADAEYGLDVYVWDLRKVM